MFTMHFALTVPELLEIVFEHSEKLSNSTNIRVCKQWCDIGRPVLWRNINGEGDFQRLIRLLGEIDWVNIDHETEEADEIVFSSYPGIDDWERFSRYSKLVRTMVLRDLALYHEVFSTISEARPCFNLFPNLRTLDYVMPNSPITPCLLFMQPTVTRFTLTLPNDHTNRSVIAKTAFILDSITRMSVLCHLEVTGNPEVFKKVMDRAVNTISGLTTLRAIILPQYCLTPDILEKFAHLPHLEDLRAKDNDRTTKQVPDPFTPVLPAGSFPALRTLTISTTVPSASQFLNDHTLVSKLYRLHLELDTLESATLADLLKVVASTCPALRSLSIRKCIYRYAIIVPWPNFGLDDLSPVVTCLNLTSLELDNVACSLTEADLDTLASRMPLMECLILSPSPILAETNLTLRALLILARWCPRLKQLGLYIDASQTFALPHNSPEFRFLRSLTMGYSKITSIQAVAFFLAQICQPECDVTASDGSWYQVSQLLPLLARMRISTAEKVEESLRKV